MRRIFVEGSNAALLAFIRYRKFYTFLNFILTEAVQNISLLYSQHHFSYRSSFQKERLNLLHLNVHIEQAQNKSPQSRLVKILLETRFTSVKPD